MTASRRGRRLFGPGASLIVLLAAALAALTSPVRGQEPPPPPAASPSPQPTPAPGEGGQEAPPPPDTTPQKSVRTRKGFAIRITNPAHNDFRFGRSEIDAEVTAADPQLVEKVEFFVEDRLVFIDTEAPYRCFYDFGTEPRSWVIKAIAYHKEGVTVADTVILKRVVLNYAVQVNRVILYATAYSNQGERHYALDLKKSDLVLEEDGVKQTIVDFYVETRPVTMAMILDSSGSMQPAMDKVHNAASRFVDTLGKEDRALVIDFDEKVFLLQDLTADKEQLRRAITSTSALGGTAL